MVSSEIEQGLLVGVLGQTQSTSSWRAGSKGWKRGKMSDWDYMLRGYVD